MIRSDKSAGMENLLEELAEHIHGTSRINSIETDICVSCKKPATTFKDELSRKEFSISGLCQECQDKVFG